MIQAIIFRDDDNLIVGFEISGHAGYEEVGKDIVCAAASVLATTTVNSLVEQLQASPSYKVEESTGFLQCFAPNNLPKAEQEKAQIIFKTLEIGLKSIEQEYGKFIKIRQRRWTQC